MPLTKKTGPFQSFIFLLLNLVRDRNYDQLPSYSLANWEECRKLDVSYYELKEFERAIKASSPALVEVISSQNPCQKFLLC